MCCEAGAARLSAMRTRRRRPTPIPRSAFARFCFPPEVIALAVRWYLRFGLSYRATNDVRTRQRFCESCGAVHGGSLSGFDVRHRGMTHNGSGAHRGCLGDELAAVVPGVDLARRMLT